MQSMWTTTLHKGDIVRVLQNTFMWTMKNGTTQYDKVRVITEPQYGLIVEEFDNACNILLNGESWMVSKNYLYPGS